MSHPVQAEGLSACEEVETGGVAGGQAGAIQLISRSPRS